MCPLARSTRINYLVIDEKIFVFSFRLISSKSTLNFCHYKIRKLGWGGGNIINTTINASFYN